MSEQKKNKLNKTYAHLDESGSRVSFNDDSAEESEEEESGRKPASSTKSTSGVSSEEITLLSRRVDRLEHAIGSIVSKIDAVLVKFESMEKTKSKRKETMGKIFDSIKESEGNTDDSRREQLETLVREELQRWDSESSFSPSSSANKGVRPRSRPSSAQNKLSQQPCRLEVRDAGHDFGRDHAWTIPPSLVPIGPLVSEEKIFKELQSREKLVRSNTTFLKQLLTKCEKPSAIRVIEQFENNIHPAMRNGEVPMETGLGIQYNALQQAHPVGPQGVHAPTPNSTVRCREDPIVAERLNALKKELNFLTKNLSREWKFYLRALGMEDADVDMVETDYPRSLKEQIYQSLVLWVRENKDKATKAELIKALRDGSVERNDLASKLQKGNY